MSAKYIKHTSEFGSSKSKGFSYSNYLRYIKRLFNRSDVYVSYSQALHFKHIEHLDSDVVEALIEKGLKCCKDRLIDFSENRSDIDTKFIPKIKYFELNLNNAITLFNAEQISAALLIAVMCLKSELNHAAHEIYRDCRFPYANTSVPLEIGKVICLCEYYDLAEEDELNQVTSYIGECDASILTIDILQLLSDYNERVNNLILSNDLPVSQTLLSKMESSVNRAVESPRSVDDLRIALFFISEMNKYLRPFLAEEDYSVLHPDNWGKVAGEWGHKL